VVREVVVDEVMELKAQPGGDLALGGADLAATFMRHDLIDEYRLYVHPVVIGRGKPLFEPSDATVDLRLAETRTLGNGVVLLRCQRPRTKSIVKWLLGLIDARRHPSLGVVGRKDVR